MSRNALMTAIERYRSAKKRLDSIEQYIKAGGKNNDDVNCQAEVEFDVAGKAIVNWTGAAPDEATARAAMKLAVEETADEDMGHSYLVAPMLRAAQAYFDSQSLMEQMRSETAVGGDGVKMPGIIIRDFDLTDADTEDLGNMLRDLPPLIQMIEDMLDRSPWSKFLKGRTDITGFTRYGKTLHAFQGWLKYQKEEAYQALRTTKPKSQYAAEYRASDLLEIMSRQMIDYEEISRVALAFKADQSAVLDREPIHSWTADYLKERESYV